MSVLQGEEVQSSFNKVVLKDNSGNVLANFGPSGSQGVLFGTNLIINPALNTTFASTIQIANQTSSAPTFTIIDTAGNADFVMTAGTQTIGGQKTFSTGITFTNGINIAVGAGTGTKIGTLNTQKIGFYGVAPVIQAISSAGFTNATGTADNLVVTNNIVAALRGLGLVAVA